MAYAPALPLAALLRSGSFRPRGLVLCDDPHSRRPLAAAAVEAVCARLAGLLAPAEAAPAEAGEAAAAEEDGRAGADPPPSSTGKAEADEGPQPPGHRQPCLSPESLAVQMAVSAEAASALSAAIPLSPRLRSLRLCMRRADLRAAAALLAAAAACASLTSLEVSSTALSPAAVRSLAAAVSGGSLLELSLSACDAEPAAAGGLDDGHGGGEEGIDLSPLAAAVRDPRCALQTLSLADMDEIRGGFPEALGESLRVAPSLESVGVRAPFPALPVHPAHPPSRSSNSQRRPRSARPHPSFLPLSSRSAASQTVTWRPSAAPGSTPPRPRRPHRPRRRLGPPPPPLL